MSMKPLQGDCKHHCHHLGSGSGKPNRGSRTFREGVRNLCRDPLFGGFCVAFASKGVSRTRVRTPSPEVRKPHFFFGLVCRSYSWIIISRSNNNKSIIIIIIIIFFLFFTNFLPNAVPNETLTAIVTASKETCHLDFTLGSFSRYVV